MTDMAGNATVYRAKCSFVYDSIDPTSLPALQLLILLSWLHLGNGVRKKQTQRTPSAGKTKNSKGLAKTVSEGSTPTRCLYLQKTTRVSRRWTFQN